MPAITNNKYCLFVYETDPDLLPATSVAAGHQGLWDYGIEVAGKSKKCGKQTPTLEAGNVWLQRRGRVAEHEEATSIGMANYQLVPVSSWWEWQPECIWSHCLIFNHCG